MQSTGNQLHLVRLEADHRIVGISLDRVIEEINDIFFIGLHKHF